jgi:hypothetical protein
MSEIVPWSKGDPLDIPRCPADTRAWNNACAPGRCTAAEMAGSPNYARFMLRPESSDAAGGNPLVGSAAERCSHVVPSGLEDRDTSHWREWLARVLGDPHAPFDALECLAGLGIGFGFVTLAIVLARFWGII